MGVLYIDPQLLIRTSRCWNAKRTLTWHKYSQSNEKQRSSIQVPFTAYYNRIKLILNLNDDVPGLSRAQLTTHTASVGQLRSGRFLS